MIQKTGPLIITQHIYCVQDSKSQRVSLKIGHTFIVVVFLTKYSQHTRKNQRHRIINIRLRFASRLCRWIAIQSTICVTSLWIPVELINFEYFWNSKISTLSKDHNLNEAIDANTPRKNRAREHGSALAVSVTGTPSIYKYRERKEKNCVSFIE